MNKIKIIKRTAAVCSLAACTHILNPNSKVLL